ncbi:MAG: hypothetical protein ACD_45C00083G0005 [uncultured bacterium]|nr:MAG: hypothetical protein ACD_45C00083G0005 [uncultured bacterium]
MIFIQPDWPAPPNVKACTTTRVGGVSLAPYNELNLALHVGDAKQHVQKNRTLLKTRLALPSEPIWLEQTHSTIVVPATADNLGKEADATFASEPNCVCVVLTADCLPILLCNRAGTHVAAIHAGWRGLANGIIENTLKTLDLPSGELLAWLGPAIGPNAFEIGHEVRDLFLKSHPDTEQAFLPSPNGRWLGDLYALASLRLHTLGITNIYGKPYCTYSDKEQFFSYRRDGSKTGRMASLIWIAEKMDSRKN